MTFMPQTRKSLNHFFGIYHYKKPERYVDDYSSKEKEEFCDKFKEIKAKYDHRNGLAGLFRLIVLISIPIIGIAFKADIVVLWFLMLACVFLPLFLFPAVLYCPGCFNNLPNKFRNHYRSPGYCPECGNSSLQSGRNDVSCTNCGKMYNYNFPNYKIHYCNHCGIFLDKEGVPMETNN